MTKTEYNLSFEINGIPLDRVSTTKSLGVLLDENLTWSSHINKMTKRIASGIGTIKQLRPFVSLETLHVIYQALIQPHFDYCNVVWGNCGKTLSNKLQKLQNRAMRVLTFSNFDADANSLLEKLGWDDLNQQHQFQKALMVFKSLNNLAPKIFQIFK